MVNHILLVRKFLEKFIENSSENMHTADVMV